MNKRFVLCEGRINYDDVLEFDTEFKKEKDVKNDMEITLEKYLEGNIKIQYSYKDKYEINKDDKIIFIGTLEEINRFIAGIEYIKG